ncbi:uncharacterized protein B0H18DRAFT_449634 [Fomitopsis serialis]|uniref:uncharacterized protein n=1 Tax=Fomitopsis serialis TaxID=139415 RepID=UPI0020085A02|nr:uncharacterized protein B0H18DRAFT_449634 [Neoantrodia serialis]KAH9923833.1 hypothetical protein B0H18DRAFT_449634 [Neoantrodia serialis]
MLPQLTKLRIRHAHWRAADIPPRSVAFLDTFRSVRSLQLVNISFRLPHSWSIDSSTPCPHLVALCFVYYVTGQSEGLEAFLPQSPPHSASCHSANPWNSSSKHPSSVWRSARL